MMNAEVVALFKQILKELPTDYVNRQQDRFICPHIGWLAKTPELDAYARAQVHKKLEGHYTVKAYFEAKGITASKKQSADFRHKIINEIIKEHS